MGNEPEPGNPHLEWERNEADTGDVRHYAMNTEDEICGYLKLIRWGRHTHWTWFQEEHIGMSPGCLEEVRKKQKELFKDRRKWKK